jgi:hypothetical protein
MVTITLLFDKGFETSGTEPHSFRKITGSIPNVSLKGLTQILSCCGRRRVRRYPGNIEPRFSVSYLGKKLGNFSIALSVSPWAIVQ